MFANIRYPTLVHTKTLFIAKSLGATVYKMYAWCFQQCLASIGNALSSLPLSHAGD